MDHSTKTVIANLGAYRINARENDNGQIVFPAKVGRTETEDAKAKQYLNKCGFERVNWINRDDLYDLEVWEHKHRIES